MTSKQILDAFSETLMRDERILSPRERELLMSLVNNARNESSNSPEIQSAVTAAIARSVGETVAQRAFALLGSSIVEQIVTRAVASSAAEDGHPFYLWSATPKWASASFQRAQGSTGWSATPERSATPQHQSAATERSRSASIKTARFHDPRRSSRCT